MEVIAFTIWGKFAHFRKFWTTSSSLSYPFPPPTAVRGILGAILGYHKREYIKKTEPFKVGIEILNPVKSIKLSINFLNTKDLTVNYKSFLKKLKKKGILHTQTIVEVLKNPKYRIFVSSDNLTLLEELKKNLLRGENHYTLSLGWANFLANYEYDGTYCCEPIKETNEVRTIVPVDHIEDLKFEDNLVGRERIPVRLLEDRKPVAYESVIFSLSAKPLKGTFKNLYHCKELGSLFLF
jgi:CRISPR-associated protein Cas5h